MTLTTFVNDIFALNTTGFRSRIASCIFILFLIGHSSTYAFDFASTKSNTTLNTKHSKKGELTDFNNLKTEALGFEFSGLRKKYIELGIDDVGHFVLQPLLKNIDCFEIKVDQNLETLRLIKSRGSSIKSNVTAEFTPHKKYRIFEIVLKGIHPKLFKNNFRNTAHLPIQENFSKINSEGIRILIYNDLKNTLSNHTSSHKILKNYHEQELSNSKNDNHEI